MPQIPYKKQYKTHPPATKHIDDTMLPDKKRRKTYENRYDRHDVFAADPDIGCTTNRYVDGYRAGNVHTGADIARRIDRPHPTDKNRKNIVPCQRFPEIKSVWCYRVNEKTDRISPEQNEAEFQKVLLRPLD